MPCALSATPAVARAGAALGGEVCGDAWRRMDAACGCDPWGRRWWNCMALLVPFSPCVVCGPGRLSLSLSLSLFSQTREEVEEEESDAMQDAEIACARRVG